MEFTQPNSKRSDIVNEFKISMGIVEKLDLKSTQFQRLLHDVLGAVENSPAPDDQLADELWKAREILRDLADDFGDHGTRQDLGDDDFWCHDKRIGPGRDFSKANEKGLLELNVERYMGNPYMRTERLDRLLADALIQNEIERYGRSLRDGSEMFKWRFRTFGISALVPYFLWYSIWALILGAIATGLYFLHKYDPFYFLAASFALIATGFAVFQRKDSHLSGEDLFVEMVLAYHCAAPEFPESLALRELQNVAKHGACFPLVAYHLLERCQHLRKLGWETIYNPS